MSPQVSRRLAFAFGGLAVLIVAAGTVMLVTALDAVRHYGAAPIMIGFAALSLSYALSGVVVASRRPSNPVGWIMLLIAVSEAQMVLGAGYVALYTQHWPAAPLPQIAAWSGNWAWIPGLGGIVTFLLLLFPDGHPPTPRWRWVAWTAGIGILLGTVGTALATWSSRDQILVDPSGNYSPTGIGVPFSVLGQVMLFGVAGVASIVSVVVRWRRAGQEERKQLRWFLFAVSVVGVGLALSFIPGSSFFLLGIGLLLMPISIAVAVLKYRLYDIDVVIRRAVVFGLLAAFITVMYAAIVGVVSLRFSGSQAGSFVAAATLAVLFAPARDRARRIADRLVYGKRATPYEVLAEFSERVGGAYAADDVLARMAHVLMEGTGAQGARVLLQVGSERREAVSVGERGEETTVEVTHQGQELGALAVSMPAAEPMNPAKEQLVEDLAAQAGLVLRNVKLIEELKASRQRLVAAQDEERRKIERNIHDGAQQQLVALAVQLKLAAGMVGKDPEKERTLLETLGTRANDALEDLRDLARGIYPPLLADKGLAAALEAQARRAAVPVTVESDALGRFSEDIEATVYFCTLEALNNVAKYADAGRANVRLTDADGHLRFEVQDDGDGFDPNETGYGTGLQGMADRLASLGGELIVTSAPGAGTTVEGRLPAEVRS